MKYELIITRSEKVKKEKFDTLREARLKANRNYGDAIQWYKDEDSWFSKDLGSVKYRIVKCFERMPY